MSHIQLSKKTNTNGQRVLVCKVGTKRAFSVQTDGNLPIAASCDNNILANDEANRARVIAELKNYVSRYGTATQKESLAV